MKLQQKALTYSYRAQPYDAPANKGFMSDTLNIYFVAKAADIGLITKFQAFLSWKKKSRKSVSMGIWLTEWNTIDIYRCEEYDGNTN